jgi:hypothetical protein
VLFESRPKADNPAHSEVTGRAFDPVQVFTGFAQWLLSVTNGRCIFVSDNPAYDFQWINYGFDHAIGRNPFGYSARRKGFLRRPHGRFQQQPGLEETPRDSLRHNPVNDAMGNVEAFARLLTGERERPAPTLGPKKKDASIMSERAAQLHRQRFSLSTPALCREVSGNGTQQPAD